MDDAFTFLLRRGIDRDTLRTFGVTAIPSSWTYPVVDRYGEIVARRHKRRAGTGAKYWWDRSLQARPDVLYGWQNLHRDRAAILCAGEPDCWLLHTLGLPACTLLTGEGAATIPDTAAQHLHEINPAPFLVLYDHDDAGRRGGQRTAAALVAAGITAVALALPNDVPAGGDVTDLYAACGRDRERFVGAIAALQPLPAPIPEQPHRPRRVPAQNSVSYYDDYKRTHPLVPFVEAIAGRPGRRVGHELAWRCILPGHDDHTPSFFVNADKDLFLCRGCGRGGDIITLLSLLGSAVDVRESA